MDLTACAFSRESLASMSRKTMQISNQSEIQALVPFKSIISCWICFFSPISSLYLAQHTTLWLGLKNHSYIRPCFNLTPYTQFLAPKVLKKMFSTSRHINLALFFQWPSSPLFPKMCQDFQQKEYTTMHSVSPKTLSFAQAKVSEEMESTTACTNCGELWPTVNWEEVGDTLVSFSHPLSFWLVSLWPRPCTGALT